MTHTDGAHDGAITGHLAQRRIGYALLALAAGAALLLFFLPAEKTLGGAIKIVLLHGALVQAGLFSFAAAGLLGALYLLTRREGAIAWCAAAQKAALAVWAVYVVSSMAATYLAWGQLIAWDEPRVRASAYVLLLAATCLLIVWWVRDRVFTALVNVAAAAAVYALVKGVSVVRHPLDPIGASTSVAYRLASPALLLILLVMAALLAWTWRLRGGIRGEE